MRRLFAKIRVDGDSSDLGIRGSVGYWSYAREAELESASAQVPFAKERPFNRASPDSRALMASNPNPASAENPTSNPDTNQSSESNPSLGRFKSADAKQRSLANLRAPFVKGQAPPAGVGRPKKDGIFMSVARRFARKKSSKAND